MYSETIRLAPNIKLQSRDTLHVAYAKELKSDGKIRYIIDLLRYKIIKIAAFCSLLSSSHIPSFCGSPLFALSQIIPQQV